MASKRIFIKTLFPTTTKHAVSLASFREPEISRVYPKIAMCIQERPQQSDPSLEIITV